MDLNLYLLDLNKNRSNFLYFIIYLVFFKKKFVWENMNFLKRKFFLVNFGNWSYQNDCKIFVIFSCLYFLDLKHEKNHIFFKNYKFKKICQKHEKFYWNGTYLVPFCLFDFSANYHINFMKIWKICVFSKKNFFVVPNSKYLFLALLNIEILKC